MMERRRAVVAAAGETGQGGGQGNSQWRRRPMADRAGLVGGPDLTALLVAFAPGNGLAQDPAPVTPGPSPAEGGRPSGPAERRESEDTALLEFESTDGAFSISPTGNLHYDVGTIFGQQKGEDRVGPGDARGTLRRARIGVNGRLFRDFGYTFVWNFAVLQQDGGRLDTLSIDYSGLKPLTFVAGAFKPRFALEDSQGSNDLLFLERAAVVGAASSLAAGTARIGGGVEASGHQLFGAAYYTGGRADAASDERQRGIVARVAGAPFYDNRGRRVVHLGVSAAWVLRPAFSATGNEVVRLAESPELRTETERLVDTGTLLAGRARTAGLELGASWDRFWAQAEYHRITVQREGGRGNAEFDGWYAQTAYVLAGRSRRWRGSRAAWGRPEPSRDLDPARGNWGAFEVGLRYSRLDLNDRGIRGGRQGIWTAGLSWYPTESLRVTTQYQYGRATPAGEDDDGTVRYQAAAVRLQASF